MVVGFCILLALILPSAYDEMKEGWKHRVIPNSRTLRDYRNDTYPKDKPGVNYELKNVRKSFSGIQRLMCLCFDKIKIQGSLVFIKYVDELIGFTDLGVSDTRYSTLKWSRQISHSYSCLLCQGGFFVTSSLHLLFVQHMVPHFCGWFC